jgi:hypothetical protein
VLPQSSHLQGIETILWNLPAKGETPFKITKNSMSHRPSTDKYTWDSRWVPLALFATLSGRARIYQEGSALFPADEPSRARQRLNLFENAFT